MAIPTCPTDCTAALPVVNFSDCAPDVNLSEIRRIFLAKTIAKDFSDWTEPGEWTNRISQTDVESDDAIRPFTVIADKPAGDANIYEASDGRDITLHKSQTLNFTIDDVSDDNYEFLREGIECGGQFKMWYETQGGKLFGGNTGIRASVTADSILGRGRDEVELIEGSITWKAKHSPERADSPIFDSDYAVVEEGPEGPAGGEE